ncbi:MAG: O-antigen ligase family protein [Rhizobiaceae bacterium]|nr:O-antigen ligase family protein [Rhizobiaceae bacterium]
MDRLLRHDDHRTEIFTYICFAAAPVAGSVASVAVNAGAVGGVIEICRRIIPLTRDRLALLLTSSLYLYSFAYTLSLAFNPEPSWKNLVPILPLLMFPFLYSSWCISHKATVAAAVLGGSALACYGGAVIAAVQFHLYGTRAEGGAGNAIVFATVICLAASMVLAGVFYARKEQAIALLGAYCAGTIAILYSGSRATWIALLLSSAVILWISRDRWVWRVSRRTLIGISVAIAAIVLVASQTIPHRVGELVTDWHQIKLEDDYDSSLGRRLTLWEIALSSIAANPFIGTGPQSTKPVIAAGFALKGLDVQYSHFHNGFLTAWVETGIVGLFSLIVLFLIAVVTGVRILRDATAVETRLGGTMLVVTAATYLTTGMSGIIVGHDILDAMLLAFLAVGSYLAAGTSVLATSLATTAAVDVRHEGGRQP